MDMSKLLLSVIFNLARCLPTNSGNLPGLQRTFRLQNSTNVASLSVVASWATSSAASCANSCVYLYPDDCQAFIFKNSTGLCTLVSSSTGASPVVTTAEDLYYSACDASSGFQYVVSGSTKSCFGIFGPGNYSVADSACVSMGAILMSVKAVERLTLLLQVSGTKSVWVGCDDLSQKRTYRWKDDGSVLTNQTIAEIFIPGDPNYAAGEDCICLSGDRGKLADYTCSFRAYYACEITT